MVEPLVYDTKTVRRWWNGRTHGRSVIELLIDVLVVSGVIVLFAFLLNAWTTRSRAASCVMEMQQLSVALSLYFDAYGTYPATDKLGLLVSEGLIIVLPNPRCSEQSTYTYRTVPHPPRTDYCLGVDLGTTKRIPPTHDALCAGPRDGHPYDLGLELSETGFALGPA